MNKICKQCGEVMCEDDCPRIMARQEWMDDFGVTYKDIFEDEDGEFIFHDNEVKIKKIYLPKELMK